MLQQIEPVPPRQEQSLWAIGWRGLPWGWWVTSNFNLALRIYNDCEQVKNGEFPVVLPAAYQEEDGSMVCPLCGENHNGHSVMTGSRSPHCAKPLESESEYVVLSKDDGWRHLGSEEGQRQAV